MSTYQYLQLQPVEPDQADSPLDEFPVDETINLNDDDDEETLDQKWAQVLSTFDDNAMSIQDK